MERSIFGPRNPNAIDGARTARFQLDREFYDKVRAAKPDYRLVESAVVPANSGRGFRVPKGHIWRVTCVEGPQTADVGVWNANDPKDRIHAVRTGQLEGWCIHPFTRVWSEAPAFRPLTTCVDDTVVTSNPEEGWHHHFTSGHCTPEMWEMKIGPGMNACHLNLLQGMEPFGLTEDDMSDCINVHQKARVDAITGIMYYAPVESKKGDYVEFYAEVDLIISLSVCPSGDGTIVDPLTEQDNITLYPLGVEIFDTGIEPKEFPKWTDWRPTWTGEWIPSEA